MGLPRATAFRFGQGHFEAVFNFYFNSRRDQKRARQIHELERVAILFLGLRHDARNAPSCFKSSPETMKPQKAGRMTQTSTCWTGEDHFLESKKPMCLRPRKWDCCSDLFAKNCAALTKSNTLASVTEWQDSGEHGCWLKVSTPPACCQSLPKHHVVWNCLGVVVAGFRNMAWVRCWFRCDIAGGMLFSVFALAVDRFVTIGRRTAQFCFGLLMRCLFLGSPPSPP